jgi:PAS domain S-box-containing protein
MSVVEPGAQGRAQTDEALAEARFQDFADESAVMMWRADREGRMSWFSRPWLELVGRPLEAEIGDQWTLGIPVDDARMWRDAYATAVAGREPFSLRFRVKIHDGSWRWILDRGAPTYTDGRFSGYRGSRADVTELVEVTAHKDILLSELNHRVKNNLQLVIAFLSFSVSQAEGEEARRLLNGAIRRVQGVGVVQEQLHRGGGATVDLSEYLPLVARSVVGEDASGAVVMLVDVAPVRSPVDQAASLGLIVSELVSDAARRDAADGEPVLLRLAPFGEDRAELTITGGGAAACRANTLVAALARHAKAVVERSSDAGGLVRLIFPILPSRPVTAVVAEPNR